MNALAGLLRQRREYFGAIGRKGILLAAIAALLLVLAFATAVTAVMSLRHKHTPQEELTGELAQLLIESGRTATALLRAVGTVDGHERVKLVRYRWALASARVAKICGGGEGDDRRALRDPCEKLTAWRAQLDRDLSIGVPLEGAVLDRATTNVLDLVEHLSRYGQEYRKQSDAVQALADERRSLLVTLVIGTGGAMGASFVLFYVVAGAAAANRKRWLASERSEKAALEARQQLLEAIEALPMGFGLYDRDGRMVMFNRRLAELNPDGYTPDVIGQHYDVIIDRLMARRPDEADRKRVGDRLRARFRSQLPGALQGMPDGRYFESNEVHTPSGYVASCRVDVTALKRREAELEASEARYRQVVDSMIDAVFTSGSDGLTYISSAALPVLGMAPQDTLGLKPADMFHAEDLPRMLDCLRALRSDPGSVHTVRLRTGGKLVAGRWLEARVTASGPADERGHFPLTGVMRDIDAQVQMEQAQRDDMMKLRSIVESSGALIALVDSQQRIVLANRTFLDAARKPLDEVIGRRYEEVVDCGDAGGALTAWLAGQQREAFAFDQVLPGSDGARRVVRVAASHVHDDDGHVNYSLFLGVDETERRSAEVRALDASRLATLGEMATGIAHEINQPLTVVQFGVDALAADLEEGLHRDDPEGFAEDALRHITRVRNQAQRAAAIVRRLQGFARKGDDVAQPFDIAEAIAGATDLVAEQMRLARINVDLNLPAGLPSVHGHANRLQQVVINLMINARDAINEDRARVQGPVRQDRIDIRAFHDATAGRLVIELGDSGPGIPEQVLPRLFESFFTTKPKGKGTGLGLSISTDIMNEMRGTITAENRPERGALFRMSFPVAVGELSAAA